MKFLRSEEFRRAVRATRNVLLEFVARIVCQFAINMERYIFPYPFTLHSNPVSRFQKFRSFKASKL